MRTSTDPIEPLRLPDGSSFDFGRTRVMGILNTTPDSFSDGGLYVDAGLALERALQLIRAGADIIDIGGESTRPGSDSVSPQEQIRRTVPVISALRRVSEVPISIDTTSAEVARHALEAGASLVNDISAFRFDADMIPLLASSGVPAIAMHTLGRPREMQDNPSYQDVVRNVCIHLADRVRVCQKAGIEPSQIVLDPGIGFGKTLSHNLSLLRHLHTFKELGHALLVGTSRKSFLGALTGKTVEERADATAASVAASIVLGADIVRVHDVDQLRDTIRVADAIRNGEDS